MRDLTTLFLLSTAVLGAAGGPPRPSENNEIEVRVERHQPDRWEIVDAQTVFQANDEIRFRFRCSFSGYLYVMSRSSGREIQWLYPRSGASIQSRVEAGKSYLVPGLDGWFRVGGTPGYDVTYWLVSPTSIETSPASPPSSSSPAGQPQTLLPRCRDELLKARGICTDEHAGPRKIASAGETPSPFWTGGGLSPRELSFHSEGGATYIAPAEGQHGPLLYEFWLAHQ